MEQVLAEAAAAGRAGEVPVAASLLYRGIVFETAQNRMVRDGDATSHAELLVLRHAAKHRLQLHACTLVVSLEPCAMCAGAIVLSRVRRVVFGAWDDKAGMSGSVGDLLRHPKLNHRPEVVGGVESDRAAMLLQEFFRTRR